MATTSGADESSGYGQIRQRNVASNVSINITCRLVVHKIISCIKGNQKTPSYIKCHLKIYLLISA